MHAIEPCGWRTRLSWAGALPLAALFLVSGLWKVTDPEGWAARIAQLQVPAAFSLAAALAVGIAETAGAVWILVPRFRRWGALLLGFLLAAFMIYFAWHYTALRGADCSCFPWVKRVVGPRFFLGDAVMLLLAAVAGLWARRPQSARSAAVVLATIAVFALVSYGVEAERQSGTRAPDTVTVEGQPYAIATGRVFLYFFNPGCMHCFDTAKHMAQLPWGTARLVAVPVEDPQFAGQFLQETGLRAVVSTDFEKLKPIFGYTVYPFGVALENGREKAAIRRFEGAEPDATLRRLGWIE